MCAGCKTFLLVLWLQPARAWAWGVLVGMHLLPAVHSPSPSWVTAVWGQGDGWEWQHSQFSTQSWGLAVPGQPDWGGPCHCERCLACPSSLSCWLPCSLWCYTYAIIHGHVLAPWWQPGTGALQPRAVGQMQ